MNLHAILELLKKAIGGFDKIQNPAFWSVLSVQTPEGSTKGQITSLTVDPKGLAVTVAWEEDGTPKTVNLKAVHFSTSKLRVLVNDEVDADAALIFAFKGNLTNPDRWAFDFKRVTLEGADGESDDYRFNLRFDPK